MSMTVHLAIKGVNDLELLTEAIRAMGGSMKANITGGGRGASAALAIAAFDGRRVEIRRNTEGDLTLVGDRDWRIMSDERFMKRLRQQYGAAAVKKKAVELGYRIADVREDTDGNIRIAARAWR